MRWSNDRGATLVHVAISLMGLLMFSGFVVDYGVFWVARRQAQNAADAGALSGAAARIYNDPSASPSTTSGQVYSSIVNTVALNPIWGQAPPAATVDIGWACPDGTSNCVRVDVYRDGSHSSTRLPTLFMKMGNVQSQGTRAHAVAQIVPANQTGCLRPWFLIDRYTDANNDGQFDAGDTYNQATTGYHIPQDMGTTVTFHANLSPSAYGQIDVGSGGSAIRDAIEQCVSNGLSYYVGESVPVKPGGTVGPERQGVQQLLDWDQGAHVDTSVNPPVVRNSCAPPDGPGCSCPGNPNSMCPNGPQISPRVAVVPVCAPTEAACAAGGPSNSSITIQELLSFFIVGYAGNGTTFDITAILIYTGGVRYAGIGAGAPPSNAEFLKTAVLVR